MIISQNKEIMSTEYL